MKMSCSHCQLLPNDPRLFQKTGIRFICLAIMQIQIVCTIKDCACLHSIQKDSDMEDSIVRFEVCCLVVFSKLLLGFHSVLLGHVPMVGIGLRLDYFSFSRSVPERHCSRNSCLCTIPIQSLPHSSRCNEGVHS